ncbi:hypothetical protein R3P38DRAFT_3236858 [Favolaschia claudopus]|uniref:Uncharacterized protein n=1 Tax=Favolaschia claudopus TaxID=2862362 RepID=A0AAV9ZD77_9AGAR
MDLGLTRSTRRCNTANLSSHRHTSGSVVCLSSFAFVNDTSLKNKFFLSRHHRNFGPILKDNVLIWPVLEGARARRNVYARSPARHRISFIDTAPVYRDHLLRRSTAAALPHRQNTLIFVMVSSTSCFVRSTRSIWGTQNRTFRAPSLISSSILATPPQTALTCT